MARKKKHDDDEPDDLALGASEAPEPEAEDEPDLPPKEPAAVVAEDPEQPPAEVAEQPVEEAPVEEEEKEKKRRGPKLYTLQVSRNDSDWADVAHSTVALYPDQRDLQQVPVGYTKAQAKGVEEDWERAGYNVRLVEVGAEPEPEPEPEPAPEPEPPVEP